MNLTRKKTVAFLDIGTNSIRLLVVRFSESRSWKVLTDQKMVVRLGEGEFGRNRITPEAISRAKTVLIRFIQLAREVQAEDIIAVATSALREAENRRDLIDQISSQTGVDIQIISGNEEARLIWLGIQNDIHCKRSHTLFIDIGGGSTEVSIGDAYKQLFSCSLKLGAIRTTQEVAPAGYRKAYTTILFDKIRNSIREQITPVIPELKKYSCLQAYGSSGTIVSLETIARNYRETAPTHIAGVLTLHEVNQIIEYLGEKSLEDRRKLEGLNPARADIIIAGACILQMILQKTDVQEIQVTDRGLRDGLLQEYLRIDMNTSIRTVESLRQQIIQEIGETFRIDVPHAERVQNIATMLYESGEKIHLFSLPGDSLELLTYAAYLHDIGHIISYSKHQYHSYYLIRSLHMPGFSCDEKEIIALIARYHRKKVAREKDEPFFELSKFDQRRVKVLSYLLRIAENLDRSHDGRISRVTFNNLTNKAVALDIECPDDISLELAGMYDDKGLFRKIFGVELRAMLSHLSQKDLTNSVCGEVTS
nr:Ppx/GppA phosphatase family protein [uncultured Methanospirillum sp.]